MSADHQQTIENEELLNKYLVFTVDESYALELSKIKEILEFKSVTPVPETPAYIAGVMNLRGTVTPLIDLRKRFRKPDKTDLKHRCVVVIHDEGTLLGLLVDGVSDLIEIDPANITPPPQVGSDYAHVFIRAIGVREEQMVLIVDTDRLVHHSDLAFLEDAPAE